MINVKTHTRKVKKGQVRVKAHPRTVAKHNSGKLWEDLKRDYPLRATPKDLIRDLITGRTQGFFIQYGFKVPFHLIRETADMWVVGSELILRAGGTAGGIWYIPKSSPQRGVFD